MYPFCFCVYLANYVTKICKFCFVLLAGLYLAKQSKNKFYVIVFMVFCTFGTIVTISHLNKKA